MLKNLSLMSLSISDIFGIDASIVIFSVLCINFVKIHLNNEVVLSITFII